MKNKYRARIILTTALSLILAAALIVPAGATLSGKTIQVLTGADIFVDGIKMEPTDANGNPVDTFVFEGTTYIPLRAVSQSLGYNVKWDGENQRVYIGEVPGEKQYLLSVCPPYQTDDYDTPTTMLMAGKKYANGFITYGYALFNLNGQYSTLSFDVGHIDNTAMKDSTLNIYLDGSLAFSIDLSCEMLPQHYEIPLHNALQMKIEMGGIWGTRFGLGNIEVY